MNPTTRTALATTDPQEGKIPPAVRQYLVSLKPSIAAMLPKHLTAERMTKLMGAAMVANPKIAECSLQSIAACMITASQLGLEPASPLGHVYLVPYKIKGVRTLTLQIGYKGYFELARRSGKIRRMSALAVYRRELDLGLFRGAHEPPEIEHRWEPGALSAADLTPDLIIASYCVVETLDDGGRYQCLMDRSEIERRRACSPAVQGDRESPWDTDYPAMAAKCPVRALFAQGIVPMSSELARAIEVDDDHNPLTVALDVAAEPEREPYPVEVRDAVVAPDPAAPPAHADPEPDAPSPPSAPETPLGDEGPIEKARLEKVAASVGMAAQVLAGLRGGLSMGAKPQSWTASQCEELERRIEEYAGGAS